MPDAKPERPLAELAQPDGLLRVAVVAGSTRPGRRSQIVAEWVHGIAAQRTDAAFEVVDLADHDLPLFDEAIPPRAGMYAGQHTRAWAATVARFDAFVFVTPEYNHAPSAALKNALDYVYGEWADKAAGFVSYGAAGDGVRAVEHLRLILAELKVAGVRAQVGLSLFADWVDYRADPTSFRPRPHHLDDLTAMLDELVPWTRALRAVRLTELVP